MAICVKFLTHSRCFVSHGFLSSKTMTAIFFFGLNNKIVSLQSWNDIISKLIEKAIWLQPKMLYIYLPFDPEMSLLGNYLQMYSHMWEIIYAQDIHCSKKLEGTKISNTRELFKKIAMYPSDGMLWNQEWHGSMYRLYVHGSTFHIKKKSSVEQCGKCYNLWKN